MHLILPLHLHLLLPLVQVKIVGNIHGDEVVGRELVLGLAEGLCRGWARGEQGVLDLLQVTHLNPTLHPTLHLSLHLTLQSTEVHLLASMNPDGYVLKTRNNANDYDLNRNFPDWGELGPVKFGPVEEARWVQGCRCRGVRVQGVVVQGVEVQGVELQEVSGCMEWSCRRCRHCRVRQPETLAVMAWVERNNFVLSLGLHDGWTTVRFHKYIYDIHQYPITTKT